MCPAFIVVPNENLSAPEAISSWPEAGFFQPAFEATSVLDLILVQKVPLLLSTLGEGRFLPPGLRPVVWLPLAVGM